MKLLAVLAVAVLTSLGGPALAQRYWGPDQIPYCPTGVDKDSCRAESFALLRDKLEVPTAESLAAEGYKGLRVFQYDAFGTIAPASLILTKPINLYRREGFAQSRTIQGDGRLVTLEKPIWENGWLEMDALVAAIRERPPVEREPEIARADGQLTSRCLHAPTIIIEVIDEGQVHRWWPDVCKRDPAIQQAQQAAQIVAAAFPVCAHFPIEQYGRGLGRVAACLSVEGPDPFAAAEVMEILKPSFGGASQVIYEPERQSAGVALRGVSDRPIEGWAAAFEALKDALPDRWVRIIRASGDADGVTVTGELRRGQAINDPDPLPISIRWIREADGMWRITDWVVEPH